MSEERNQILSMLENGKISADEAARLLDTLGFIQESDCKGAKIIDESEKPNRWLRIRISEGGVEKVKVNLPLKLVQILTKMQGLLPSDARAQLDEHEIDLEAIVMAIKEGADGEIVSVEDGDDRVSIFVE
ncbi:hypothetical protein KAH81_01870 [bacterium]|nr:hypothetical protein [bacterium]